MTAQEEERRRISRDLHDQLGQQLTALRFNLEVLKGQCAEDPEMYEQIKLTESIARQLDVGVNFLAWDIRPAALDDLGLGAALANFLKEWSMHTSITVEFHKTGLMEERLSPEIETTIYRIAQEALNNVSKSAQVSHVDVILERQDGHAALMVGDDGQGFNPDQLSVTGDRRGLGLIYTPFGVITSYDSSVNHSPESARFSIKDFGCCRARLKEDSCRSVCINDRVMRNDESKKEEY